MKFNKNKSKLLIASFLVLTCFSLIKVGIADAGSDDDLSPSSLESYHSIGLESTNVCPNLSANPKTWFDCFLLVILQFLIFILSVAATIFTFIIKPEAVKAIIGNDTIYTAWALVRDSLNIAFILILLFSAFATIFQVSSYNYKNILFKVILMALLVNFSFPIARFIIDIGNSMMYFFVDNLGISSFGKIADTSQLGSILKPSENASSSLLIASVIFTFILTVTLLMIAILFVIRTVALAIIIIFAPIAFTGSIIPGVSSYASKWWHQLFSNTFFAPIMVFMLYVATQLMNAFSKQGLNMIKVDAQNQSYISDTIASMSFFSIPIVILWIGIAAAKSSSAAGASMVIGQGTKFMGWAGRKTAGAPWAATRWGFKKAGVTGGIKQAWNKRVQRSEMAQKQRESKWAGTFGDKTAGERNMKTQAAQYDKDNVSIEDLKKWTENGDAAAAYALASKGKMDPKLFATAMDRIKDTRIKQALMSKTEETRMDVTLQYKFLQNNDKSKDDVSKKKWKDIDDVAKEEYGNLNAESWAKQKDLPGQFSDTKIKKGAQEAFRGLSDPAKVEVFKRMNSSNTEALV